MKVEEEGIGTVEGATMRGRASNELVVEWEKPFEEDWYEKLDFMGRNSTGGVEGSRMPERREEEDEVREAGMEGWWERGSDWERFMAGRSIEEDEDEVEKELAPLEVRVETPSASVEASFASSLARISASSESCPPSCLHSCNPAHH